MKFLRTASTARLVAIAAATLVIFAAGTTLAVAGSGSIPVATPLANAIHDALDGPDVTGVTARVTFSNHLIDSGSVPGLNPLLAGAKGRLWWSADNGLRIELQTSSGDEQIVVNKSSFWVYDAASNTVYEGRLPAHDSLGQDPSGKHQPPSVAQIEKGLAQLANHADVSGAVPGNVGGRPAYTVQLSPKRDPGLVGSVEAAWDAANGVPLRAAIYAKGSATPVIELRTDSISYGDVPASVFNITPPGGAKVTKIDTAAPSGSEKSPAHRADMTRGLEAVSKAVDFPLQAPATLAGMPRNDVRLIEMNGKSAALVTYGHGLGGIAVLERPADSGAGASGATGSGAGGPRVKLPTSQVNGVSAQTIGTPLGAVVQFQRGAVDYTVLGSVTQSQALAAARGL